MEIEQTTSLQTKLYESSLLWKIEHFMDYSSCCIDKLKSEEIKFSDTDASWYIEISPKSYSIAADRNYVKLDLTLNDRTPSGHRLFRFDVHTVAEGHEFMSAANRHHVKSKGFYAEPDMIKPATWVLDYQLNLQKKYENDAFILHRDLSSFLETGTLTIYAKILIKSVEVLNVVRKL